MKRLLPLAAAILTLATTSTAIAQDSKFKLYAMLAYVAPLSETDQNVQGVTDAVKASDEFGFSFGGEYRASSLIGIEVDYLYAKQDVEANTAGVIGETTFQPISATLNLHFPLGTLDVYGGPTAAYVNWGDLEFAPSQDQENVSIDPEFAFGISAGVDFNLGPQLAVTGGLRWLNVQAQPDGADDALDVNPLFARAGLAIRL
jgi:opacity protein-like surface antigen